MQDVADADRTRDRDPRADPRSVHHFDQGQARITVLTDRLVRLEWSESHAHEDRASIAFVNRRLDPPPVETRADGPCHILETGRLQLRYTPDGSPFHRANLLVEFDHRGGRSTWRPGDDAGGNLGGTVRTLDGVDGACDVEPGIVSRDGWAIVDDSESVVLEPGSLGSGPSRWPWPARRKDAHAIDWYLFAHGRDYQAALEDFAAVSGKAPLPPRFALGSWWSRYWPYRDEELHSLVSEFRAHGVPLDVLVIDMDWHEEGWTGYTWRSDCFPDPEAFLRWAREAGLRVTLNLHPADGVGSHEAMFEEFARRLGRDPTKVERVPFDCADRRYVETYFSLLHHPHEAKGVEFWWMDWQQGTETTIEGLDPLIWLNILHWNDLDERQTAGGDPTASRAGRRPLIFSRWGGLGNHRYPIGFSGDTHSTWASLAWQPEFTSMAGNVGFAYWSHDIGGHQPGPVDEELYVRWVQYGALSPVLRTHTANSPAGERRIWAFSRRAFEAMRDAFRLRYALLPCLYTAARDMHDRMRPVNAPLYHEWPEVEEAYEHPTQFLLGDQLMAAPVVRPGDPTSRGVIHEVWIPPGDWFEWSTGRGHHGPSRVRLSVPLEETPLFVRAGGIVVMHDGEVRGSGDLDPSELSLVVFPGASGSFTLYEDDGISGDYERGASARTRIESIVSGARHRISIGPAHGAFDGLPERRRWVIRMPERGAPLRVELEGELLESNLDDIAPGWSWDRRDSMLTIRTGGTDTRAGAVVEIEHSTDGGQDRRDGLRGAAESARRAALLLGNRAPAGLRKVVRDAECAAAADRWALAREIDACEAPEAARHEAICRILGIACAIDVRDAAPAPGRVEAIARVLIMHEDSIIESMIDLATDAQWERCPGGRQEGPVHEARALWCCEGVPQRSRLEARLLLQRDGEGIVIPFERTILPSINGWLVAGPFRSRFGPKQLDGTFGVQPGDVDPSAPIRGGRRRLGEWKQAIRAMSGGPHPDDELYVDLNRVLGGPHDHVVALALTFVHCRHAQRAMLSLGSDDGVVVWVNGREVHRKQVERSYRPRSDEIPIDLRAGANEILLAIGQKRGAWGFAAHLVDPMGGPLEDAVVRLERDVARIGHS